MIFNTYSILTQEKFPILISIKNLNTYPTLTVNIGTKKGQAIREFKGFYADVNVLYVIFHSETPYCEIRHNGPFTYYVIMRRGKMMTKFFYYIKVIQKLRT